MEMAFFAAHVNRLSISRVGATHSPESDDACVWGQWWRSAGGSDHQVAAAAAGSSTW